MSMTTAVRESAKTNAVSLIVIALVCTAVFAVIADHRLNLELFALVVLVPVAVTVLVGAYHMRYQARHDPPEYLESEYRPKEQA